MVEERKLCQSLTPEAPEKLLCVRSNASYVLEGVYEHQRTPSRTVSDQLEELTRPAVPSDDVYGLLGFRLNHQRVREPPAYFLPPPESPAASEARRESTNSHLPRKLHAGWHQDHTDDGSV